MKATVYSVEGKSLKEINLPSQFEADIRDDLVKRAVLSEESETYQPKGTYRYAGLETSARYRGRKEDYGAVKNKGIPHLPHEVMPGGVFGKVKRVPHAVKGRRAHPPKVEKKIIERINKKEYMKALESALAYVANRKAVSERCSVDIGLSVPIIIENSFEKMKKTKDIEKVFKLLNLMEFIKRAKKNGTKAPLIVASENSDVLKAARNLAGVDVVTPKSLKVRHLAPGTHPGRVTLFTENALNGIIERFKEGKQ